MLLHQVVLLPSLAKYQAVHAVPVVDFSRQIFEFVGKGFTTVTRNTL